MYFRTIPKQKRRQNTCQNKQSTPTLKKNMKERKKIKIKKEHLRGTRRISSTINVVFFLFSFSESNNRIFLRSCFCLARLRPANALLVHKDSIVVTGGGGGKDSEGALAKGWLARKGHFGALQEEEGRQDKLVGWLVEFMSH